MWFINSDLDYRSVDPDAFWASGARDLDTTLRAVGVTLTGDERVLEIGCGIGRMTRALAARAASVVGLDVSPEMIGQAREALADLANVRVAVGSGTDLAGSESAAFDVCYSYIVFQHIPDPVVTCAYIVDMGRVLKPGGWALFQVSDAHHLHDPRTWSRAHGMRYRLSALAGRRPRGCSEPQWLGSAVARADLLAALDRGGLDLEAESGRDTQYHLVLARRRA